jgi:peroxin-5
VAELTLCIQDYLLWNRLGATLANSGHPEEAIDAYRKALEIRPTFTRAIYNLGVSCLNVHCYHEAAEHLLAGLALHKRKGNNRYANNGPDSSGEGEADDGSANLWNTLRRAFICMVSEQPSRGFFI